MLQITQVQVYYTLNIIHLLCYFFLEIADVIIFKTIRINIVNVAWHFFIFRAVSLWMWQVISTHFIFVEPQKLWVWQETTVQMWLLYKHVHKEGQSSNAPQDEARYHSTITNYQIPYSYGQFMTSWKAKK